MNAAVPKPVLDRDVHDRAFLAFASWVFFLGLLFVLRTPPRIYPDTFGYTNMRVWWSMGHGFLGALQQGLANRPIATQLLFWLVPSNKAVQILFFVLSFASWTYFATVARSALVHPGLRFLAGALICVSAVGSWSLAFNNAILPESLAMSVTVVQTASVISHALQPRRTSLLVFMLASLIGAFTTTSLAFLAPAVAPLFAMRRERIRTAVALTLYALALLLASSNLLHHDAPANFDMVVKDNVFGRMAHDRLGRSLLISKGFPAADLDGGCTRSFDYLGPDLEGHLNDAPLYPCRVGSGATRWIQASGSSTYMEWLLRGSGARILQFLRAGLPSLLSSAQDVRTMTGMDSTPLWRVLQQAAPIGDARISALLLLLVLLLRLRAPGTTAHAPGPRIGLLLALLCGAELSNVFIAYWGDTSDILRHCIHPLTALQATLCLACFYRIDAWSRRHNPAHGLRV